MLIFFVIKSKPNAPIAPKRHRMPVPDWKEEWPGCAVYVRRVFVLESERDCGILSNYERHLSISHGIRMKKGRGEWEDVTFETFCVDIAIFIILKSICRWLIKQVTRILSNKSVYVLLSFRKLKFLNLFCN
jgi:hypothetical protein